MATSAKYGARGETTFRLTKALREQMRAVAKESKSENMLEWLKTKIAKDELEYGIVQNVKRVESAKSKVDKRLIKMGHIEVTSNTRWSFAKFHPSPEGWEGYECPIKRTICNCGMPGGKECDHWQPGNPFALPDPRPGYCMEAREAFEKGVLLP